MPQKKYQKIVQEIKIQPIFQNINLELPYNHRNFLIPKQPKNKLKLEIDATTIFSITKGEYKFDRKLTLKDLKYKDKYNTYFIRGLPPKPICYVSRKTIEIVLENYKSNYLYYFFDENNQRHTFSKSFEEHKKLLKEYRKK